MIYNVYSVRDSKTSFGGLVLHDCNEFARRAFLNSIYHDLKHYKRIGVRTCDLALYRVGEFDTSTGELTSILPEFVASGDDLIVPDFDDLIAPDFEEVDC